MKTLKYGPSTKIVTFWPLDFPIYPQIDFMQAHDGLIEKVEWYAMNLTICDRKHVALVIAAKGAASGDYKSADTMTELLKKEPYHIKYAQPRVK